MRVAITSTGSSVDSAFDNRFGRASYFIIFDSETDRYEVLDNVQNYQAAQGAGIQAAQTIASARVSALITGHLGPKASRTLAAASVKVFQSDAKTVEEAWKLYKHDALRPLNQADVEGHWV